MTRRRRWLLVHRVNGLLLAVFITVVGLTGSLLAWKIQLERSFAPALFVLPAHSPNAARVDPLTVRKNVAKAFPWADVNMIDLSVVNDAPLDFLLTPKANPLSNDYVDAYVDPYSGRVLGSRRYGDVRQGWINFVPIVYNLHEQLALGDFGEVLLGCAALLWTCDCFIGMYLTFPANRKRSVPLLRKRALSWPLRWRHSWMVRWSSGGFKRLYDLHRASGVWLWVLLLVFAWTGVAFDLPAVYRPVMHVFGARSNAPQLTSGCGTLQAPQPGAWSTELAQARSAMQQQSAKRGFRTQFERFLSYDPASCRWSYRVRSTLDVDRIGNTQLIWSSGDVSQAIFSAPTGDKAADTFTTWIEAIHESQIGGYGFRTLVCLGGLVSALLSVTGVWIFVRKMGRRKRDPIQA